MVNRTEYLRAATVPFVVFSPQLPHNSFALWWDSLSQAWNPSWCTCFEYLQPLSFSTAATNWWIESEPLAIQAYPTYQHQLGRDSHSVGPCGFLVSETHPFLGATPDGTVYDSSNSETLNSHLDSLRWNVPIHIVNVVHLRPVPLLDCAVMHSCIYDVTPCISPKFKAKWLLGTDRGVISLFILLKVSMLKEYHLIETTGGILFFI